MSTSDNGGQAFPLSYEGQKTFGNPTGRHAEPGMTLRDHFAGEALPFALQYEVGGHLYLERVAASAYAIADAMLAERAK